MPDLDQILRCFPSISDWQESYLDDCRQRLLGDSGSFSVEIILGESPAGIGIFSSAFEEPEMLLVMELFLQNAASARKLLDRSRIFFSQDPKGVFHAILGTHTLTMVRIQHCTHFRVSPTVNS